jgi:hypothetical protein
MNWVWCLACIIVGLILLSKNLNSPEANLLNWGLLILIFGGAVYFYKRADQVSPT